MNELGDRLQTGNNYDSLKEYARGIIDCTLKTWELNHESQTLKLKYDYQLNEEVQRLTEPSIVDWKEVKWLAVNKATTQAELELHADKIEYKASEANYEMMKTLTRAYEWMLITARQEMKADESHWIAVNEFGKDSDLPF